MKIHRVVDAAYTCQCTALEMAILQLGLHSLLDHGIPETKVSKQEVEALLDTFNVPRIWSDTRGDF